MQRVVIIGGGFGGLEAARRLRKSSAQVTLVDRRNHHLFQPLLYQVATGTLSPANIASPLRFLFRKQRNTRVLLGEVVGIDLEDRVVTLAHGDQLPYDTLVVAAGSSHSYFGHDEWAQRAPGLKSIEDATTIRRRILMAFEEAELAHDPELIRALLTFVIVGGGPTGVELAGAIADIAYHTLKNEFRRINPAQAKVLLLEGAPRLLGGYPPELSDKAEQSLHKLKVEVRLEAKVTEVEINAVVVNTPQGPERIVARNVFWAAGVQASPLGRMLAEAAGATTDRSGRVQVAADLSLPGHPEVFIIGDLAHYAHQLGKPLPALAPVAMQQGQYVAKLLLSRIDGRPAPRPFRFRDYGTMATIGRRMAVADIRGWKFSGVTAWLLWLIVHLMQIVQFQNRLLVLVQWAWHYFSRNRAARLITGEDVSRVDSVEPAVETLHAQATSRTLPR